MASSSRLGLKGMPKSSSAESGGIASQNPLKEGGYAKTSTPKVGEFSYAPESAKHYNQYITRGSHAGLLERPYMRSSLVIDEIMQAGKSISDPWKIPGAKRWDVLGSFRGTDGTWELVLDPSQKLIYHFTFVGK